MVEPDTRPRTHSTSRITVMVQSMPYLLWRKGRSRTVVKRAYRRGSSRAGACRVGNGRTAASLPRTGAGVARSSGRVAAPIASHFDGGGRSRRAGWRLYFRWGADGLGALSRASPGAHRRARRSALFSTAHPPAGLLVHPSLRRPAGRALDHRVRAAVRAAARLPAFPPAGSGREAGHLP